MLGPQEYDPTKDPYLDNRLRADKPITFLGFIDDLNRLWKLAGKRGKIIRHQPIDEEMKLPIITFRIVERTVSEPHKDVKPRLRTTIRHPYVPGEFVELWGQVFQLAVQFIVYSESAEDADELMMEFEDFIHMYKGLFKKNGVHGIQFTKQLEDTVITDYRFPIAARPIQYNLWFEKITPIFLDQIERIAVQYNNLDDEPPTE